MQELYMYLLQLKGKCICGVERLKICLLDKLARRIEQFDPYLEIWSQLNTAGTPHPGLKYAACTSHEEFVYMYGGMGTEVEGALSCLNFGVKTPTWSQLCPAETVGGPMRKDSCSMVHFHDDKLAVIGGYGYPNGPIQSGSVFIRSTTATDGSGWTNEIHIFDLSQGSDSQDNCQMIKIDVNSLLQVSGFPPYSVEPGLLPILLSR